MGNKLRDVWYGMVYRTGWLGDRLLDMISAYRQFKANHGMMYIGRSPIKLSKKPSKNAYKINSEASKRFRK